MCNKQFMRATGCSLTAANVWAPSFAAAFDEFGITDPADQAMIIAIAATESEKFETISETFNYTGGALRRTFGTRFSTYQASMLGRQPDESDVPPERQKAIGNFAYGGTLGNSSREGYVYRSRGVLPLRGKNAYRAVSPLVSLDLVEDPGLLHSPRVAARVACALFRSCHCLGLSSLEEVEARLGLAADPEKTKLRAAANRRARRELCE